MRRTIADGIGSGRSGSGLLVLLVGCLVFWACSGESAVRAGADTIVVTPANISLTEGQAVEAHAEVLDSNGRRIRGAEVSWSSANDTIASVDAGRVLGVSAGTTTIIASFGKLEGKSTVTVNAVKVARVEIDPAELELVEGRSVQLEARAFDSAGNQLAGRAAVWSSNVPDVVEVNESGLVHGKRIGGSIVTASIDGIAGRATVEVVPVPVSAIVLEPDRAELIQGESIQLSAHVLGDDLLELTGRTVRWSSDAESIAHVSEDGMVFAASPGEANITADCEGVTARAIISVSPIPVAEVRLTHPDYIVVGQRAELVAVALDVAGNLLDGRAIEWTSTAPGIAEFEESGVLVGLAAGETEVVATIDGKSASANVPVRIPVARIEVTPPEHELVLGQPLRITARLLDEADVELLDRTPLWSTSDPAVATVDSTGLVRALGAGAATISAAIEGKRADAQITVTELRFSRLSSAGSTVCGLTSAGHAYCWGRILDGDFTSNVTSPFPVRLSDTMTFSQLSVGLDDVCGLDSAGLAYCMGSNRYGALGNGTAEPSATFVAVSGGHHFSQIAVGSGYACAVRSSDQKALCWGQNSFGELGVGDYSDRFSPTEVAGGLAFSSLAVSQSFADRGSTCGITTTGFAYCWGDNGAGQLGDGTTVSTNTPVAVSGGYKFGEISITAQELGVRPSGTRGYGHACGITQANGSDPGGRLYCWGGNLHGELGLGTSGTDGIPPTLVAEAFASVTTNSYPWGGSTCGSSTSGQMYCWGTFNLKVYGAWLTEDTLEPTAVGGSLRFMRIATGELHVCGIADDGLTYCWGGNYGLQCGFDSEPQTATLLNPNLVWGQQLPSE